MEPGSRLHQSEWYYCSGSVCWKCSRQGACKWSKSSGLRLLRTEVNQLHLDRVEQAEPVAIHDQWLKDIFNFCPLNEPTSSSSRLSDKCFLTSGLSRMIDLLAKFGYWVIFKTESWVL
ncbi:hypothetical protein Tco_0103422 [Tanacetum coccineum]